MAMSEARQLAEKQMGEVAAMPFDALIRFIEHPAEVDITGPSGRIYRSRTYAFWDREPYESDLFTRVKVNGRGLHGYQRYYGVEVRGPDTEFASDAEEQIVVSPTWTEVGAWMFFALILVAIVVAPLLAAGYLISRIL